MKESRKDKLIKALERTVEVQEELIDQMQNRVEELEVEIISLRRENTVRKLGNHKEWKENRNFQDDDNWNTTKDYSFDYTVTTSITDEQEEEEQKSPSSER